MVKVDTPRVERLRARAELHVSAHQRRIERFTAWVARPQTIYGALAFIVAWVALNLLASRAGAEPFDPPPFAWLQALMGFAALMMTVTILTTQRRQGAHAEERARLDLEVSLLAEEKAAKIIALLEELRRDMPVRDRVDQEAERMSQKIDAPAILSAIARTEDGRGQKDETRTGADPGSEPKVDPRP
jgi:uncharacterized membrane protein